MWDIRACRISTIATCSGTPDRGSDRGARNPYLRAGRYGNVTPGFDTDDGCRGHVAPC